MHLFIKEKSHQTAYIQIDTRKCEACRECLDSCNQSVLGMIDLPWHKHSVIKNSGDCTGCLQCVNTCRFDAITEIDNTAAASLTKIKKKTNHFIINLLLLFAGILTVLSGSVLQFAYHFGGHNPEPINNAYMTYEVQRGFDLEKSIIGGDYYNWSDIHIISIVLFLSLVIYHISRNWKWYKVIATKKLIKKNFLTVFLSVLFIATVISGLLPWFIDLGSGSIPLRQTIIEIHDKIALLLIVFLLWHVIKRRKRLWRSNN